MLRGLTPWILTLALAAPTIARAESSIPTSSQSPLLRKTEASISRGVRYLLARQNADGTWGQAESVDGNNADRLGETALVTLALLSSGESYQSPPLDKAIKALKAKNILGEHAVYAIALRACVLASVPAPVRGDQLLKDKARLIGLMTRRGERPTGMWSYPGGRALRMGDYSNSQYAVLGIWYALSASEKIEIDKRDWQSIETAWRDGQNDDGGWGYFPKMGRSYASMTAAGAVTLFITKDYLHIGDADIQDLSKQRAKDAALDKATAWLGEHFAVDLNSGRDTDLHEENSIDHQLDRAWADRQHDGGTWVHYMLFGYERVGEASGLSRFGTHRWFEEGAKFLIDTQQYDGSWLGSINENCDTSYALLFLSRGRSPVAIQKLQFGDRWNNRPRDASNFIHFMRHVSERHMNWQIVDADAPLADLREAPILYIASDRAIELTDAQRNNITTYVNEGGLLLFVNEGRTDDFAKSAIALCKKIWPAYSFQDLPRDHPIVSNNFPMNGWSAPIRGLSNGTRQLAILVPSGDVTWKWQAAGGATAVSLSPYAPLANLWLYLHGQSNPRFKGETTWIDRQQINDAPTTRQVARLKFTGNWDPEPLGWQRLANILHNAQEMELQTQTVELGHDQLNPECKLSHLTATEKFDLYPSQRAALKTYLAGGGLVLFDAAGGSSEPSVSFEALMADLFPGTTSQPLPVDHPIYTGKFEGGDPHWAIDAFNYRTAGPNSLAATKLPRLRGYTLKGKLIAIESPEDLSAALVGFSTGGITGYTPTTAAQIVRNIVMWSGSR